MVFGIEICTIVFFQYKLYWSPDNPCTSQSTSIQKIDLLLSAIVQYKRQVPQNQVQKPASRRQRVRVERFIPIDFATLCGLLIAANGVVNFKGKSP